MLNIPLPAGVLSSSASGGTGSVVIAASAVVAPVTSVGGVSAAGVAGPSLSSPFHELTPGIAVGAGAGAGATASLSPHALATGGPARSVDGVGNGRVPQLTPLMVGSSGGGGGMDGLGSTEDPALVLASISVLGTPDRAFLGH